LGHLFDGKAMIEQFAELRTNDLVKVENFLRQYSPNLEKAELSVRRSAGEYIAQIRSTDEPPTS